MPLKSCLKNVSLRNYHPHRYRVVFHGDEDVKFFPEEPDEENATWYLRSRMPSAAHLIMHTFDKNHGVYDVCGVKNPPHSSGALLRRASPHGKQEEHVKAILGWRLGHHDSDEPETRLRSVHYKISFMSDDVRLRAT